MELTVPLLTVQTLALATVRITGFIVVAPPFANGAIPGRVKAMLAVGIGLLVLPKLEGTAVPVSTAEFIGLLMFQVVVGAGLGFLVAVVFAAVQSAGGLIDLLGGFQIAQAFDPMTQNNSAHLGRLFEFTALVLLFASDGYQLVVTGLMRTFDALPLDTGLSLAALAEAATSGVGQLMVAALQIAGPMMVVLFLADAGLGLLTRVAPALNAFALGFPLKIFITISLGVLAYLGLPTVVSRLADTAVSTVLGVLR